METGDRRKYIWRQETGGKRYGDRRQEERVMKTEEGGRRYEDRRQEEEGMKTEDRRKKV